MHKSYLFVFAAILMLSCNRIDHQDGNSKEKNPVIVEDLHSYANNDEVRTTHLHLDLDVNFKNKTIYGVARHKLSDHKSDSMVFDMKHIVIKKITLGKGNEKETPFVIGTYDSILGNPLTVKIDPETKWVNIYYQTTEKSEALDWLAPELTTGKVHPFLYTQGQAILTRSWIPLQDTPLSRITYSADVKVPYGLMAVMSASNPKQSSPVGTYHFEMQQRIPSYLIAMAVGNMTYTDLGNKCGVYAEPELAAQCKYEFADVPKMMATAEKMYGAYQWGQYDIVMLPFSFPFGGMENPRVTFANPTLLAGDRSLVSVIAHELAHSWSGNLVTNATWNDFWLNEGFTVYFENRIMEEIYGKEISDILAVIEFQDLETSLKAIEESLHPEDSRLKLELTHRHPDEGMTDIAYVKGAFFLRTIEHLAGRKRFDEFLSKYFENYAFKTISTEEFVNYLNANLLEPEKLDFNANEWIFQPGLPGNCLKIESKRLNTMMDLAREVNAGKNIFIGKGKRLKLEDFITQEWQAFVRELSEDLDPDQMKIIDQHLLLSSKANAAVKSDWYLKCVKTGYRDSYNDMGAFLKRIGRRWYIESIYQALMDSKNPKDHAFARKVFEDAKPGYHYVTKSTIASIVN